ncbi:MAG: cardiolipin synthase [Gammaproteobacteria bacterium]
MTAYLQPLAAAILCAFASMTLTGCASLPHVQPLLNVAAKNPSLPELYGPGGRLSLPATRALVRHLEHEAGDTGLLRTQLTVTGALPGHKPLVLGNRAQLLVDGPATLDAMTRAIESARDTIDMETYIFADDKLGRALANLLIEKQKAGVQVNLIYDSVGSLDTPDAFFQRMKDAGIRVIEFNPVNPLKATHGWKLNNRDHRKLLIVDGNTVFTGGVNVSDGYSSSSFTFHRHDKRLPWRDTEVEITGPVAHYFQEIFFADWKSQHGPPLKDHDYFPKIAVYGTQVVRAISSEAEGEPNRVYIALISAISNAQRSVHLTAAYFAPDPQLLHALTGAARRGVDVALILPSRSDFWPVLYTGRSYYHELLAAGVKIYERHNALLHAKTAVIDGVWATIGSTNLDWRSLSLNAEVNAVIIGRDFSRQMERLFQRDLRQSRHITLSRWNRRSLPERIKELFGRIAAPLM